MGIVSFVDKGNAEDARILYDARVDASEEAALPYYARWTRQDLVAVVYLLNRISTYGGILLVLIAIPLWMIALR